MEPRGQGWPLLVASMKRYCPDWSSWIWIKELKRFLYFDLYFWFLFRCALCFSKPLSPCRFAPLLQHIWSLEYSLIPIFTITIIANHHYFHNPGWARPPRRIVARPPTPCHQVKRRYHYHCFVFTIIITVVTFIVVAIMPTSKLS